MTVLTVDVITGPSGAQTLLVKLDDLFPECALLTKETHLARLSCWTSPGSCHRGSFTTCMSMVVKRAYRIFAGMPNLHVIVLHWITGKRHWGLVIDRDENKEMRISVMNKYAKHFLQKNISKKYQIEFSEIFGDIKKYASDTLPEQSESN